MRNRKLRRIIHIFLIVFLVVFVLDTVTWAFYYEKVNKPMVKQGVKIQEASIKSGARYDCTSKLGYNYLVTPPKKVTFLKYHTNVALTQYSEEDEYISVDYIRMIDFLGVERHYIDVTKRDNVKMEEKSLAAFRIDEKLNLLEGDSEQFEKYKDRIKDVYDLSVSIWDNTSKKG